MKRTPLTNEQLVTAADAIRYYDRCFFGRKMKTKDARTIISAAVGAPVDSRTINVIAKRLAENEDCLWKSGERVLSVQKRDVFSHVEWQRQLIWVRKANIDRVRDTVLSVARRMRRDRVKCSIASTIETLRLCGIELEQSIIKAAHTVKLRTGT